MCLGLLVSRNGNGLSRLDSVWSIDLFNQTRLVKVCFVFWLIRPESKPVCRRLKLFDGGSLQTRSMLVQQILRIKGKGYDVVFQQPRNPGRIHRVLISVLGHRLLHLPIFLMAYFIV